MIEDASAEANDIAERIMALPVTSDREAAVHAKAAAWLEGTYWADQ